MAWKNTQTQRHGNIEKQTKTHKFRFLALKCGVNWNDIETNKDISPLAQYDKNRC